MRSSRRVTVGVDEAGRGSLVGDLFVVAVAVSSDKLPCLTKVGVRDSKSLSRSRRFELLAEVLKLSEAVVVSRITPEEIDRENINDLEVKAIDRLMRCLKSRGLSPHRVLVDEIAGREALIKAVCRRYFPEAEVVVTPGADERFPEVSAASVVAKSLRDAHIDMLKRVYGDIGSGYPSDPRTVEWLRKVGPNAPGCVRRSWRTYRRILSRTLDEFARADAGSEQKLAPQS